MLKRIHPVMRPASYVFLVTAILSLLAVVLSYSYMDDAYQKQQSERRAMNIWKNKIDGSRQNNRIIDEYENSYMQLVKNNVVGEENRLSWFETLQSTANARGLVSVKYNVTSQRKVGDPKGAHKSRGLNIYRSKMSLDVRMRHEGDLFVLLNELENRAKGLYVVDSCSIDSTHSKQGNRVENMRASCELSWYTFQSSDNAGKS